MTRTRQILLNAGLLLMVVTVVGGGCETSVDESGISNDLAADVMMEEKGGGHMEDVMEENGEIEGQSTTQVMIKSDRLMAGEYSVVAAKSTLSWLGTGVGKTHDGIVDIESGNISIASGGQVTGNVTMDMTSLKADGTGVGNHLRSDDFFGVDKFPTSKIDIKRMDHLGGDSYTVFGNLTVKGITNDIRFPAKITETDNGYAADASFEIDRTRWGVRFGSGNFFSDLGNSLIEDEIDYTIHLEIEK